MQQCWYYFGFAACTIFCAVVARKKPKTLTTVAQLLFCLVESLLPEADVLKIRINSRGQNEKKRKEKRGFLIL